jgi:hypothetical protein
MKFLKRIWGRIWTQRKAKRSLEKQITSKQVASNSRQQLTAGRNINSVEEQQVSVSLSPRLARGDFLDSTYPSMADSAAESGLTSRRDGHDLTSSAPGEHFPAEKCLASEDRAISTQSQECLGSHTSSVDVATLGKMEGQCCLLSATDSGLCSEEDGEVSSEEFLEVFSDDDEDEEDEDEDCLMWQIPAEEVSLDTVMAATGRETVYR